MEHESEAILNSFHSNLLRFHVGLYCKEVVYFNYTSLVAIFLSPVSVGRSVTTVLLDSLKMSSLEFSVFPQSPVSERKKIVVITDQLVFGAFVRPIIDLLTNMSLFH